MAMFTTVSSRTPFGLHDSVAVDRVVPHLVSTLTVSRGGLFLLHVEEGNSIAFYLGKTAKLALDHDLLCVFTFSGQLTVIVNGTS